jgi:hypothetical protein
MSPTARTLQWLREHHIDAQIVEKIVPRTKQKQDLFGAIDIVALPNRILGIQTTDGSHHAARAAKASTNVSLARWIICGGGFEIWSWRKSARSGKWIRRVAVGKPVMEEYDTFIKIEFTEKEEEC